MRVDVMPRVGSEVGPRALAGGGKVSRHRGSGLIDRVSAVAAAIKVVILSVDNVYGTSVCRRRGIRGGQRERFAKGVGLLAGDLHVEDYA